MKKHSTGLLFARGAALLFAALCVALVVSYASTKQTESTCSTAQICVAFLDMWQGDAIYIRSPSGKSMLVDGGRDASVLRQLDMVVPRDDSSLTYVVATHPDLDHIGGLTAVVDHYRPQEFLTIKSEKSTGATEQLDAMIIDKNVNRVVLQSGDVYDLGAGVLVSVLYPFQDIEAEDSNEESIVLMVTYGESRFLLTGDAPMLVEHMLVRTYGDTLRADVLKAGHHGSKTSSSAYFLAAVDPAVTVISAGKDNSYGHPHEPVIAALLGAGTQILSTIENSTIITESDGQKITVRRR